MEPLAGLLGALSVVVSGYFDRLGGAGKHGGRVGEGRKAGRRVGKQGGG